MSDQIEIEYNNFLKPLEEVLSYVDQPGEYFVEGSREIPMPCITIEGVGQLSFPILDIQARSLIQKAGLAPYGKGEETVYDISVRKTWQISPDHIRIEGKSWAANFNSILEEVKNGLGCQDVSVSLELYKLLIYDEGGFFLPHRDSEKSPGMFGTLILALPSSHEGGELIINHNDNKAIVDLSGAEGAELKFCAFYAGCEHEVLPITKGYRICLVFNLINNKNDCSYQPEAPCYFDEIPEISKILKEAFKNENPPAKLIWLLEHQYSQAELSFKTLKNADAAIATVLKKAADLAECAIHLGIVHIEESGSAEADFGYYSSRSRRGYYQDSEKEVESDEYEVLDICDSNQYIDDWIDRQNNLKTFGQISIEPGELLPSNALDGEEPDTQRLLEATGNAGVSFERAYHRAALILWPKNKFIEILLQSSIKSGIAYFREQLSIDCEEKSRSSRQADMINMALAIICKFENLVQSNYYSRKNSESVELLLLLCRLKEKTLIERFIHVIKISYDGSENDSLIAAVNVLSEPELIDHFFSELFQNNMPYEPVHCIYLFEKLNFFLSKKISSLPQDVLKKSSRVIVDKLKGLNQRPDEQKSWERRQRNPINSEALAILWQILSGLDAKQLQEEVLLAIISDDNVFDPRTLLAPFQAKLHTLGKFNQKLFSLWEHASTHLLNKSEYPPAPPTNWTQKVQIKCSCEDCKCLVKFAQDPMMTVHRFKVGQDRRNHISTILRQYRMDVSTETEETGRPYTLVCTKTRQSYQEKCNQHEADIKAMQQLIKVLTGLSESAGSELVKLRSRLKEAVARIT